jgi:hypothetical protein
MKQLTQDNEEFSFISLAAATANVVRYLEGSDEHQRDGERNAPRERDEKEKADDRRKAVEHGLRQIQRFEDRFRRRDRA